MWCINEYASEAECKGVLTYWTQSVIGIEALCCSASLILERLDNVCDKNPRRSGFNRFANTNWKMERKATEEYVQRRDGVLWCVECVARSVSR